METRQQPDRSLADLVRFMRKALVRCQQDGIGDVLLASAARLSNPARWRQVNFERYSAGRFSTSIPTSASVVSSMTSAMMIRRGNGRDQFALGRERSSQGRIYSIWMDEPVARKSSPAAPPALKCICPGKQVPFYHIVTQFSVAFRCPC